MWRAKENKMIDPKLFTVERMIATMLDTSFGNVNAWWPLAEIVIDWMPPFPQKDTSPKMCIVKCKNHYLRHSKGPSQGHSWDSYPDDYQTAELALIALSQAPI